MPTTSASKFLTIHFHHSVLLQNFYAGLFFMFFAHVLQWVRALFCQGSSMKNQITRRRFMFSLIAGYVSSPLSSPLQPSVWAAAVSTLTPGYPVARLAPVVDRYWGVEVVDRYRWMEALPRSNEWQTWLAGQAKYARKELDRLPNRADLLSRINYYSAAFEFVQKAEPAGKSLFILKRTADATVSSYYVQDLAGGAVRMLLDPSKISTDKTKPSTLDATLISPGGNHMAVAISSGGSEISTTYLIDVPSGKRTVVTFIDSRPCGWAADGKTLYYYRLRADAKVGTLDYGKGGSVWEHRLGTDPGKDQEVFRSGEGPDFEALEFDRPQLTGAFGSEWVMGWHETNGTEVGLLYVARSKDLLAGKAQWRKIGGRGDIIATAKLVGNSVYVIASGEVPTGQVIKIDAATETCATGTRVLSKPDFVPKELAVARDGVYVLGFVGIQAGFKRIGYTDQLSNVALPRSGKPFALAAAADLDGAWYQMDDLTEPGSTYRIDATTLKSNEIRLAKPPSYDTSRFTKTLASAKTRDGVDIPLEIVHKLGLKRDGRNPLLIQAYGAYGLNLDPGFSPSLLAFLEAGGVMVYAHVRGGGEFGEAWHRAGQKATKPNTWRDAIDSAEYLIKENWTAKGQVALWGTSAGGIMVGRAVTERPDMFAAAIGEVGLFNTMRFELTSNGPGNDIEFGTVKKEDEFKALLAMDSYHAVQDGVAYPAMLLITGANDNRVEPWQIGKFAARLQAASPRGAPVLLRVDFGVGHFASITRKSGMEKSADIYSFVLKYCRPVV